MEIEMFETSPAVAELVDAILESHAQLSLMVAQMMAYPSSDDAMPIPNVVSNLFRGTLDELQEQHGDADVALAAQMLRSATQLIIDNIFIYVPEGGIPKSTRAQRPPKGQ
jgi:hypothetical protein